MKEITLLLILTVVVSGCSTYSRMVKYKNANGYSTVIEVAGDVEEVKSMVRDSIKELGLIEEKDSKQDNFMAAHANRVKSMFSAVFLGPVAGSMVESDTQVGFFFEYNKDKNLTTITLTEGKMFLQGNAKSLIVDNIKLKELERVKADTDKSFRNP